MGAHVPRRRCVGCGRIAPKAELVRIAALHEGEEPARAVRDEAGTMPGRGAYLCLGEQAEMPAVECLTQAIRRRAIPRALRSAVALDAKLVELVSR